MDISPRFAMRWERITPALTKDKLREAWKSHVRNQCRKQSVLDIMDYQDIHMNLDSHLDEIILDLSSGKYVPKAVLRVRLEKSKGLCRQIIIPDALDALVLQCAVNHIYNSVIKNRPNDNSYFQHSCNLINKNKKKNEIKITDIESDPYTSTQTWLSFQKRILGFSCDYKYLVVTDISNYFDNIDTNILRSIYIGFENISEEIIDFILYTISFFHWRPDYAPANTIGLPQMNFDAPRLLAHSFLYDLDKYATEKLTGAYARYMDDIDAGANTPTEAKKIIGTIDDILHTRGCRLNSGKTKILTSEQAAEYYFMRDNRTISLVENTINRKINKNISLEREIGFLQKKYKKQAKTKKPDGSGYFDIGNGEKILKRYIWLSIKHSFMISRGTIHKYIKLRPSLREICFNWIAHKGFNTDSYDFIVDYMSSGYCVDDASMFQAARCLVYMGIPNKKYKRLKAIKIAKKISSRSIIGFISSLFILSKYGNQEHIIKTIKDNYTLWEGNEWAGRQVGAMYTRLFTNSAYKNDLIKMLEKSRNTGGRSVLIALVDLHKHGKNQKKMFYYLRAKSTSMPREITQTKILLFPLFMKSQSKDSYKKHLTNHFRCLNLDSRQKYLVKRYL